jgi:hypothetical protein
MGIYAEVLRHKTSGINKLGAMQVDNNSKEHNV